MLEYLNSIDTVANRILKKYVDLDENIDLNTTIETDDNPIIIKVKYEDRNRLDMEKDIKIILKYFNKLININCILLKNSIVDSNLQKIILNIGLKLIDVENFNVKVYERLAFLYLSAP